MNSIFYISLLVTTSESGYSSGYCHCDSECYNRGACPVPGNDCVCINGYTGELCQYACTDHVDCGSNGTCGGGVCIACGPGEYGDQCKDACTSDTHCTGSVTKCDTSAFPKICEVCTLDSHCDGTQTCNTAANPNVCQLPAGSSVAEPAMMLLLLSFLLAFFQLRMLLPEKIL